ncbi:hypothetical protein ES288_D08G047300v1 [Gossypium darwinii]|uniref:Uncharacterized protein n=1 Tax=Gossypium darwinii TaxID=34276 RepID=A0A5D2BIJ8_GOSDA|nr:hypothetical protein ES288_D08G047300v1 [Gossypium darwinii]
MRRFRLQSPSYSSPTQIGAERDVHSLQQRYGVQDRGRGTYKGVGMARVERKAEGGTSLSCCGGGLVSRNLKVSVCDFSGVGPFGLSRVLGHKFNWVCNLGLVGCV